MVGVITSWDVLAHPVSTVQCFGWRVFFRAVVPWHEETFLSVLQDAGCFGAAVATVPTILDRCIALELRAKHVYKAFAKTFVNDDLAEPFFSGLAEQEQHHADLLSVCRTAAIRNGWKVHLFNPWQDYLPRLEQQMESAEATVPAIHTIEDALRLVIELESSEINSVFEAALAATDAAFVKRLKPFRETMVAHMTHIVERIPALAPQMMFACRELRAKFPFVRS